MRTLLLSAQIVWASALMITAGCAGNSAPGLIGYSDLNALPSGTLASALKTPALITLNTQSGSLEYWPIRSSGGTNPRTLSAPLGIYQGYGLVASGDEVAIANYNPAEIVTYNVKTKAQSIFSDPYGGPTDLAIGKNGTLYALNLINVAVFPPGSSPSELSCSYINNGQAIAVDNEGDVFVNGYGPGGFMGVVEYPVGSQNCKKLHLRAELGYAGGVGVDPKTDALIVVDNPNLCAGGFEGRMIIYPKPYEQRTSRRRNLAANYCAGTFRLDATSSIIFVSDSTISAGFPLIDQRSYPSAKGSGVYQAGEFGSSGYFGGFTTIPNTLPN
jgi:hypothetical protein